MSTTAASSSESASYAAPPKRPITRSLTASPEKRVRPSDDTSAQGIPKRKRHKQKHKHVPDSSTKRNVLLPLFAKFDELKTQVIEHRDARAEAEANAAKVQAEAEAKVAEVQAKADAKVAEVQGEADANAAEFQESTRTQILRLIKGEREASTLGSTIEDAISAVQKAQTRKDDIHARSTAKLSRAVTRAEQAESENRQLKEVVSELKKQLHSANEEVTEYETQVVNFLESRA